jgi:hypothetical protein
VPPTAFDYNGAQPVPLPDGTLVIVFTAFADPRLADRSEIVATRSVDGGVSFSAPVRVAAFTTSTVPSMRTFALPSAEVDSSGRVYAAWEGCLGTGPCSAARILLSSSLDGITWTAASAATPARAATQQFLPGLGVDSAASGRLALVYHSIPAGCSESPRCPGIDIFQIRSVDGGHSWSKPQRLTAEPIALDWIARTRLGRMLADYVSVSYVLGRPVSVFAVAAERVAGAFRQAILAYRSGPAT